MQDFTLKTSRVILVGRPAPPPHHQILSAVKRVGGYSAMKARRGRCFFGMVWADAFVVFISNFFEEVMFTCLCVHAFLVACLRLMVWGVVTGIVCL